MDSRAEVVKQFRSRALYLPVFRRSPRPNILFVSYLHGFHIKRITQPSQSTDIQKDESYWNRSCDILFFTLIGLHVQTTLETTGREQVNLWREGHMELSLPA